MASKEYTLMDVYRAAKSDRKFDFCFWAEISCGIVAEYIFLQLGRILVMVASILITTICASGFLIVLPVVAVPSQLWFKFNLIWGAFLVFSIIFNYISAVITDPGKPTAYDENTDTLASGGRYLGKTCKKCILPKPARTHHCSICRRCVLKMDHHCPWINNCVGLNNYRYFYSFLLWTCLGTFYLAFLLSPTVLRQGSLLRVGEVQFDTNQRIAMRKANANLRASRNTKPSNTLKALSRNLKAVDLGLGDILVSDGEPISSERSGEISKDSPNQNTYFQERVMRISAFLQTHRESEFTLSLIFILSGAISFAVSILLALHTYLVLSAQTTIEFFESIPERSKLKKAGRLYLNPYNKGWRGNVKQVFGYSLPLFFAVCLPSCKPPPPDFGSKGRSSGIDFKPNSQGSEC